ncbi:hypothetical protein LS482_17310 [Sinomicrobium kalidii]|uniref:hypothetical protein n=1 Tax=Sinomicrobium kalidii TaxID=2900738 RepID=UPI001E2AD093|nr:hypothetical protein [Sinomicrobium kalidii]UGU15428.1 hypothetical protein LS482_17310 [Sinomicrobium kalidii]
MELTTITAIYGALLSTSIVIFRFLERRDLKRKIDIDVHSFVKKNKDNEMNDLRCGGQYLLVTMTNRAKTTTYIDRYFFKVYNQKRTQTEYCGFDFKNGKLESDLQFPIKLEHGEIFKISYPLTDFQNDNGKQNMDRIREMAEKNKYLEAYCCDTLEKWHNGQPLNIQMFCGHFDLVEENLTKT